MVNHKQAKRLVEKQINKPDPSNLEAQQLAIIDDLTIEKEWGWVFFYNTVAYIKSGNFLDSLVGNAPYIVNKHNGDLVTTGTAEDIDYYIEEYEAALK